ncbi:BAF_collapsed_G0003690.mRNA.1.CDS.1 [Saccharomyces cerevisiae]|nr:BAF_collapsed_G0003690.mRNA.1.CDS.1 [Saccharomyces cerevisiae]
MNIVPQDTFKSQVSTDQDKSVLSSAVPSLPDTLRQQEGGAVPLSTQLNDRHPLESTLKNWETTQRKRQMEQYRQIFGIAEPMKRTMEMEIVNRTDFNPFSTNGSIHRDILLNKECSIDWEDVYPGTGLQASTMVGDDVHSKIEKQLGI